MPEFGDVLAGLDGLEHVFDNEDFGHLLVSNKVTARNELGRFAERVHQANENATALAGRRGAAYMRRRVPSKTGHFASTIHWRTTGSTRGEISWGTDYWRYLAYGARPHDITGQVTFFWEREGRWWGAGDNIIKHPGIRPHLFIEETYYYTQQELEKAMRDEYRLL